MHLPPHPAWFWPVALAPFVIWVAFWAIGTFSKVRLKRLAPWLIALIVLSLTYLVLDLNASHRFWRLAFEATFYTCWMTLLWIQRWYQFESIGPPNGKWYTPWRYAKFSIRNGAIVQVRDLHSASRWYADKFGLEPQTEGVAARPEFAKLAFKQGGKSVVLAKTEALTSEKRLILFTRKIGRMKDVLTARGLKVGSIEQDRQGTAFFEICDPDGNEIEVVQES